MMELLITVITLEQVLLTPYGANQVAMPHTPRLTVFLVKCACLLCMHTAAMTLSFIAINHIDSIA